VSFSTKDKSLYQFCAKARYARKNPGKGKGMLLTDERTAALDAIGFIWTARETPKDLKAMGLKQLNGSRRTRMDSTSVVY